MIDHLLLFMASPYGIALALQIDSAWTTNGGYYLNSPDGRIQIWIANSAYGLWTTTKADWPKAPGNQYRPSWADRHLIWRAVKRLRLPSIREFELRAAMSSLAIERER